jgi:NADH dehydrogenase
MLFRRSLRGKQQTPPDAPKVVVVGGGFAGFHALRRLERLLPADQAALTVIAPMDYVLYSPLLPEVATGVLDPRDIAVSLRQTLHRTRPLLGYVTAVDFSARTVTVRGKDDYTHIQPPRCTAPAHRWTGELVA